ncbi:ATP phosphoribosyltransferase [Balneolales bacterium ANBcel1]|nr:ATP phosphoribosyltransferase [Balneolales bacterium ANBcel1]
MEQNNSSLRIAIQKGGRLSEKTLLLLENIGLEFDNYKNRILVPCRNYDVELLLIRDDDIPEYVQDGICELGFVGHNVWAESKADVTPLRGLGFGKCRLSVAVPKNGGFSALKDLNGRRIATSYPVLTREHFEKQGLSIKTIEISGAVEIAPTLDVADAISDIVSTGGTLKTNGLIELETILESEAELIRTNRPIADHKQELIQKFLMRMEARQKAEKSRYIMMNAPADASDQICSIIPSLKSPTVLPLAEENMVAIHSVIPIHRFWEVMEELKAAGASGIVILPIENMIV